MGRNPSCSKVGMNRGAWSPAEDKILMDYVKLHGEGKWNKLAKRAGLKRCGKSCRLRWSNYLRPDIKRGNISHDEEELIVRLHKLLGNRWSLIAGRLPGRTDNEIKNYWNTVLSRKISPTPKPSQESDENHKKETSLASNEEKLEMENAIRSKEIISSKAFILTTSHETGKDETRNFGKEQENSALEQLSHIPGNHKNKLSGQDQVLSSSTDEGNMPSNSLLDCTWEDLYFTDFPSSEFLDYWDFISYEHGMSIDIDWTSSTPSDPLFFGSDILDNWRISDD